MHAQIADTELLYLADSTLLEADARIVALESGDALTVILDRTIFYPQGGGQPCDTGKILGPNGSYQVVDVRQVDGVVRHACHPIQGMLSPSSSVKLIIDAPRRTWNSKLHSAGHVIDVAIRNLNLHLTPSKGYHFPDSPYVEYDGEVNQTIREETRLAIEGEANTLIQKGFKVVVQTATKNQLETLCGFVPTYALKDDGIRVVTVAGNLGCPCGGTHVTNISEIGQLEVGKIRVKSGKTRVSYRIN